MGACYAAGVEVCTTPASHISKFTPATWAPPVFGHMGDTRAGPSDAAQIVLLDQAPGCTADSRFGCQARLECLLTSGAVTVSFPNWNRNVAREGL